MMLALKSGPQITAKVGNPAGLLCQRIWYSVGKSGVLGITEYRQGRPLIWDCNWKNGVHVSFTPEGEDSNIGNKYNTHMSKTQGPFAQGISAHFSPYCDWATLQTPKKRQLQFPVMEIGIASDSDLTLSTTSNLQMIHHHMTEHKMSIYSSHINRHQSKMRQ